MHKTALGYQIGTFIRQGISATEGFHAKPSDISKQGTATNNNALKPILSVLFESRRCQTYRINAAQPDYK
jgi:hypothetical protein